MKKNNNNYASNSQFFGRWPQTKTEKLHIFTNICTKLWSLQTGNPSHVGQQIIHNQELEQKTARGIPKLLTPPSTSHNENLLSLTGRDHHVRPLQDEGIGVDSFFNLSKKNFIHSKVITTRGTFN